MRNYTEQHYTKVIILLKRELMAARKVVEAVEGLPGSIPPNGTLDVFYEALGMVHRAKREYDKVVDVNATKSPS